MIVVVVVVLVLPDTGTGPTAPHTADTHASWVTFQPRTELEASVGRAGCDLPRVTLTPKEAQELVRRSVLPKRYNHLSGSQPLLLRRDANDNKQFRELTSKAHLLSVAGDSLVGVDFPGVQGPPTRHWESLRLRDYIDRQMHNNWTLAQRVQEGYRHELRYLFGPSDSCYSHNQVNMRKSTQTPPLPCMSEPAGVHAQFFPPGPLRGVFKCFLQSWGEDEAGSAFGVGGSLSG
eukprot:Hpha_TRINITY_DN5162_c0_g2::TRINITY_DN5162_c0_g2_i1::g.193022::m.193022